MLVQSQLNYVLAKLSLKTKNNFDLEIKLLCCSLYICAVIILSFYPLKKKIFAGICLLKMPADVKSRPDVKNVIQKPSFLHPESSSCKLTNWK